MLLIYSHQITARLQYVLDLFFNELIKTEYQLTDHKQEFLSSSFPKLNYSTKKFNDECFLNSCHLLFEAGIHAQEISLGEWNGVKTLFAHNEQAILPFDPFAAAFYLTSRYEEYLPFQQDEHGRFPDKESINFRYGFHEIPVVNHYAVFLKEILARQFPSLQFQTPPFQFQLTYDVDFAFAYRHKGIARNIGGLARSILKSKPKEFKERLKVLSGKEADPFDTFDYQNELHRKLRVKPVYFFLLGNYGKFDKNISWNNRSFQNLIRSLADQYEVGLHSSYDSGMHSEKILIEKNRLEKIAGKKIFRNRQHFLKLRFPVTYQNLLANKITEDYTMGYASLAGFRAGIASSFSWYDLSKEAVTALRIFPFAVMDAALYYYLKLSPDEGIEKIRQLIQRVRSVDGTFQFLAHNDVISNNFPWKGWRQKFEEMIDFAYEL